MQHRNKCWHNLNQCKETVSKKKLVINLCSIRNKVADRAVCIGEYNPDIIIGTETHLDSSVNSYQIAYLCCPRMITLIHSGIQELEEDGSQRGGERL